jgi:predicted small secreted protein
LAVAGFNGNWLNNIQRFIQSMEKHILISLLIIIGAAGAPGCKNTARGMGKDIERTGEKIQEKTQ